MKSGDDEFVRLHATASAEGLELNDFILATLRKLQPSRLPSNPICRIRRAHLYRIFKRGSSEFDSWRRHFSVPVVDRVTKTLLRDVPVGWIAITLDPSGDGTRLAAGASDRAIYVFDFNKLREERK